MYASVHSILLFFIVAFSPIVAPHDDSICYENNDRKFDKKFDGIFDHNCLYPFHASAIPMIKRNHDFWECEGHGDYGNYGEYDAYSYG